MEHSTVLLVDDNQAHQYSLGKHLSDSGFKVLQAQTGAEALELAFNRRPNAVLLDINLPDITGFAVCEALKADSRTAAIPVIFHSATHDTQAAQVRAMDLGAVSFLSYPINVEHVVMVLKGAILQAKERQRRTHDE